MKGDYANSRIYRIVCNDTGKQYFGSTTQSLAKRLSRHKAGFKQWQKGNNTFTTSYEIIEGGNFDIVLVEELPNIKNIEQLRARERYHIEANECVNKVIPNRTLKEYYVANKEEIKAKSNAYYAEHKEKVLAYQVDYNKKHREKIASYQTNYRLANYKKLAAQHAEYRENHKEEARAYHVKYREDHKEEIAAQRSEKVICEHCGAECGRANLPRHHKTKKCLAARAQN